MTNYDTMQTLEWDDELKEKEVADIGNLWLCAMNVAAAKDMALKLMEKDGSMFKYLPKEFRNDKDILYEAIRNCPEAFRYASPEIKTDRGFAISVISADYDYFVQYASPEIRNDKKLAELYASLHGDYIQHFSEEIRSNRDVIERCIEFNDISANAYAHATNDLRADKSLTLKAVREIGTLLKYASDELKADRDVVMEAVKESAEAFNYASNTLKADKQFVIEIIRNNYKCIKYVSNELKNDKDIITTAVSESPFAIEYVSDEIITDKDFMIELLYINPYIFKMSHFKKDYEFVSIAVGLDASLIKYVPNDMINDELIITAVEGINRNQDSVSMLGFASEELRGNSKLMFKAIVKNGNALEYAADYLKDDEEFVTESIIHGNNRTFMYASKRLRDTKHLAMLVLEKAIQDKEYSNLEYIIEGDLQNDRDVVSKLVSINGLCLKYAPTELQSDYEIVMEAVKSNASALEYASGVLKTNYEIVMAAVNEGGYALSFADKSFCDNKDVVLAALRNSPMSLKYASNRLRGDYDVVMEAVSQNGDALEYADIIMREDKEIAITALSNSYYTAYEFVSEDLKKDPDILEFVGNQANNISEIYKNDKEAAKKIAIKNFYCFYSLPDEIKNDRDIQDAFLEKWAK
ncbi:MAG: DUF4116 domain-containing protein [Bacillota bacterium]|nr:DUF4116 domain-containing protein [Bacillota bacterium]